MEALATRSLAFFGAAFLLGIWEFVVVARLNLGLNHLGCLPANAAYQLLGGHAQI